MGENGEPQFLSLREILEIHADVIGRYGGRPGIKEIALLDSALAQPSARFDGAYLHSGLCEMAAAYLYHLCGNHPFVDGNKRVAAVAAVVFLELNGLFLSPACEEEFFRLTMATASGKLGKSEIAAFFSRHATTEEPR